MFTAQQIKDAHAKVKTGADYPRYVQDLKKLGVSYYEYSVEHSKNMYYNKEGVFVTVEHVGAALRTVSENPSSEKLEYFLKIHQQGQSDFPTFCAQAAEVGVEKWTSDLEKMVCSYFDKKGNTLYAELIPGVS
jgi:uncharacterized protein YbcV (DUF1398 family)